jgi:hypothetical protein
VPDPLLLLQSTVRNRDEIGGDHWFIEYDSWRWGEFIQTGPCFEHFNGGMTQQK